MNISINSNTYLGIINNPIFIVIFIAYLYYIFLTINKYFNKLISIFMVILNILWLFSSDIFILGTVDSLYYNEVLQQSNSVLDTIVNSVIINMQSNYVDTSDGIDTKNILITPLPYFLFNYFLGTIFSKNIFLILVATNTLFTFIVIRYLKLFIIKKFFYISLLFLLISPSIILYSHILHKELFVLMLSLLTAICLIEKRYLFFFILLCLDFLTRKYSFVAVSFFIYAYFLEQNNYKINFTQVQFIGFVKYKLKINLLQYANFFLILVFISIFLLIYKNILNATYLNQLFLNFIAIYSTPVFYKFENFTNIQVLQTIESFSFLAILGLSLFGFIKKFKLKKQIILLIFLQLMYIAIIANEATMRLILIDNGILGEDIPRKKILILPLIYFFIIYTGNYYIKNFTSIFKIFFNRKTYNECFNSKSLVSLGINHDK